MAHINLIIQTSIDASRPVEELEQVITAVINLHPGKQDEILQALRISIDNALSLIQTIE